jgi:O-antigen/teichoic acid export membrane protein
VSERRSFRSNTSALAVGQAITWSLSLLTFTLLPRHLGPASAGHFAVGLSFAGLSFVIGRAGFNTLLTREIARSPERAATWVPTLAWLGFTLGAVGGVVSVALARLFGYEHDALIVVAVLAVSVPFGILTALEFATAQGVEQMSWQAVVDCAGKALILVAVVFVIARGGSVTDVAIGYTAAVALTSVFALAVLRRIFPLPVALVRFSPGDARALLHISAPFLVLELVTAIYVASDVLILSRLGDATAAGIYQTPYRIIGTMLAVPVIIGTVVFPRMAAAGANGPGASRLNQVSLRATLAVTIPIAVVLVGIGGDALIMLVGDQFAASRPVAILLAITFVPMAANILLGRIAVAAGRERWWSAILAAVLCFKVALMAATIPLFEARFDNAAAGAAFALLVAEVATTAVALAGLRVVSSEDLAAMGKLVASGTIASGAVLAAAWASPLPGIPTLLGGLAYAGAVLLLRAHTVPELRSAAASALGRVRVPELDSRPRDAAEPAASR